MSILSDRITLIAPSPTLSLSKKAADLKAQGRDILSLGMGEPDFGTPEWVKEAAAKAMRLEKTKYTPVSGTTSLKQAIQDTLKAENNLSYTLDEITVGTGGKQIIFNALMATINPGDEVLIPAPYWVSYPDITRFAGGVPLFLPCSESDAFKLSPERLAEALSPRTKWLLLNSPSNPTGAVYSEEELKALAEVLEKHPHVWVLSDDIYKHILYTDTPFTTMAQAAPSLKDRTLTLNGVSKAYAMTGWRIGYAGGPRELIEAMNKLQSHSTSNPCSIAQEAAEAALRGPQGFLQERAQAFKSRRDRVLDILRDLEELSCLTPQGAFYLYPSCAKLLGKTTPRGQKLTTDTEICRYFLEDAEVAVVPGAAFGLSPAFRLSYATDLQTLEKACYRLKKAIQDLV